MKTYQRTIHLLISIALLLSLACAVFPAQTSQTPRAQQQLLQLAQQKPGEWVSVVVQKVGSGTSVEQFIARTGGEVTRDLSIINGLEANMSSAAAVRLAQQAQVRWVSLNAAIEASTCTQCVDTTTLANAYISAIGADKVWNKTPYAQGKGIGIAIIDSGINPNGDLYTVMGENRLVANARFNTDYNQNPSDGYGHGTHVASIAGGNGRESGGKYIGVAPSSKIINVKVSNDNGSSRLTDVIAGLQWVLNNKNTHNIRVVNLSLNSSMAESYKTSPLDAAVEILWFNGIVVVVSAGNQTSGVVYPPANDPFAITVGAVDDKATTAIADDVITNFSAFGTTETGAVKPDLVAPGRNITARLVNTNMGLAGAHPANIVSGQYFTMSGTSMAAPMVSGAVALLLSKEPSLTPDQVKYRLMATANKNWTGYNAAKAGAGYLDIYTAAKTPTTQSANTGTVVSTLLTTGTAPVNSSVSWNSVSWNSVSWNSVSWNSVSWNSVSWNSVSWNSVSWNSDYWGN